MSDWCTGMLFALAMPVAKRVQNSMNALTASPDMNTKKPNARLAQPTIGTRFTRSASHPIGTAPSTKNADDAVAMKTIVPAADPERPADLGREHVDGRALELVERAEQQEDDEHELAADLERVAGTRRARSATPGQQVVGEDDLLARALLRSLARILLVEHGGGE